jgi:hypothetical protein
MANKAKELDNTKDGDRNSCVVCNPPKKRNRVGADKVWAATLAYGGNSHR